MPKGIPNEKHEFAQRAAPALSTMVGPMDDMGSKEELNKNASVRDAKGKPKGRTFTVTIHPGPGDDMSDVLIGHNYVLNSYKRNVPVQMDEFYLNVLRDAVVTTDKAGADGVVHAVTMPQYSYTVE